MNDRVPSDDERQLWQKQRFALGMELRKVGQLDPRALTTILDTVPRENFVSPTFWPQVYENIAIPTGEGQTVSAPEIVCQMTSALRLEPHHRLLEIGTGSGYQCAVLSQLCREVVSIERFESLAQTAAMRLDAMGYDNIIQLVGNGFGGAPRYAPFDRIMLTAAPEHVPPALIEQLAPGGIMVAPIGRQNDAQYLVRLTKTVDEDKAEDVTTEVLGRVRFVPLVASMPQG